MQVCHVGVQTDKEPGQHPFPSQMVLATPKVVHSSEPQPQSQSPTPHGNAVVHLLMALGCGMMIGAALGAAQAQELESLNYYNPFYYYRQLGTLQTHPMSWLFGTQEFWYQMLETRKTLIGCGLSAAIGVAGACSPALASTPVFGAAVAWTKGALGAREDTPGKMVMGQVLNAAINPNPALRTSPLPARITHPHGNTSQGALALIHDPSVDPHQHPTPHALSPYSPLGGPHPSCFDYAPGAPSYLSPQQMIMNPSSVMTPALCSRLLPSSR